MPPLPPYSAVYDAPETVVSMLLDGEFTRRGGMNALVNPMGLTPPEREGMAARMKQAAGKSSLGNALVDVALNPWVWLYFATSAAGGQALKESAQGLTKLAPKFMSVVAEQPHVMKALGLLTGSQVVDPQVREAMFDVTRATSAKAAEGASHMQGLNLRAIADISNPLEKAAAQENHALLIAALEGRGRDLEILYPKIAADNTVSMTARTQKAWAPQQAIDSALDQRGLRPAYDQIRSFLDQRKKDLFGRDGAAAFEADPEKILNVYRGLNNRLMNGNAKDMNHLGVNMVRQVLGEDIQEAVQAGKVTQDQFFKIVTDTFGGGVAEGHYFPKNVFETVGQVGDRMQRFERVAAEAMGASTTAIGRDKRFANTLAHPDDLSAFERAVGGGVTKDFRDFAQDANDAITEAVRDSKPLRLRRLDAVEALDRYNNDTAKTWGWHVSPVSPETWQAVHEVMPHAKTPWTSDLDPHWIPGGDEVKNIRIDAKHPQGRWNNADVVYSGWLYNQDEYSRNAIERVLVPAVSGRYDTRHLFTNAVLNSAKQGTAALLNTGLGDALTKAGGTASRVGDAMKSWADTQGEGASDFLRGTASYLYTTHLGLNLSSANINLTQPLNLASSWLGAGNTLKGMASAMGELGGYAVERAGMGAFIDDAARAKLIQKHFKHADLLGIGPTALEQLDSTIFSQGTSFREQSTFRKLNGLLMTPFTMAEMVNRAAVGHAVENAFTEAGRATHSGGTALPEFNRAVRQLNNDTQFASHPLNTPLAFISQDRNISPFGRALTNPLVRQFLSFPFRSFTSLTYSAPRFAGREGGFLPVMNDFARAMGVSAIAYESIKNLTGADVSRIGPVSTNLGVIPGISQGRFDKQNIAFPLPPVLDIGAGLVAAVATDDKALFANSASRLIPGGIALSRALGVFPSAPTNFLGLQKTYAGWNQRSPDGMVPLFKEDGTLVSMESPSDLVMRGLGADLGKYQQQGSLDGYLIAQRDEITRYRRLYLQKLIGGNAQGAEGIKKEYEKRFKMPMTVTKEQVRAMMKGREVGRSERILDRIPADVRPMYQNIVAQTRGANQTVSPDVLTQVATSLKRSGRTPVAQLDPAAIAAIRAQLEQQNNAQGQPSNGAFNPYSGYTDG